MTQHQDTAHFNMLEQQVRPSEVLNPRVLAALEQIDRKTFVEDYLQGLAYADTSLPIGFGQVMLSPVIIGRILQALDIKADEHVFEIGTGSGYFTSLLAHLAKTVTTVDIIEDLSQQAQQRVTGLGIDNVNFEQGDASKGWALDERVDVIVASAAFVSVPDEYLHALTVGGRMLAVIGQGEFMQAQLISRQGEKEWHTVEVFETVLPPMINAEPKPQFEF